MTVLAGFMMALCSGQAQAEDDCVYKCPTKKGAFGQREVDPQCVLACELSESSKPGLANTPLAGRIKISGDWKELEERSAIERLVNAIPDSAFKSWVISNVSFRRGSIQGDSWRAGATPGTLTIYDSFWKMPRAAQESVMAFELGKILWFGRINPGPREARPARVVRFEEIYRRHQDTIDALRFAAWNKEDLSYLSDRDLQSSFAYACRAIVFGLKPPSSAPPNYMPGEWRSIVEDWEPTRTVLKAYIASLLK